MFVILFMVKLVLSVVVMVKATAEALMFGVLPFVMEKIRKVKSLADKGNYIFATTELKFKPIAFLHANNFLKPAPDRTFSFIALKIISF